MANACIVLKERVNADVHSASAVINAFAGGGYSFGEFHILSQTDEANICEMIKLFQKRGGVLAVIAPKNVLPIVKGYIQRVFPTTAIKHEFVSACVFHCEQSVVFLLSCDETETGAEYVKQICIPYLVQISGVSYDTMFVRTIGASATRIESLLSEVHNYTGNKMYCAHTCARGEDVITITYDNNTSKMLVDEVLRKLVDSLGDTVYALNENSIEKQLVELLKLRKRKISVAESFTGGGIAKRITSVSGASEVYFEGVNTYNEASKIKRLGVLGYTLNTAGAVSDKTAYEMACGLLATGDCDVAVATTGLAGPKTDRSGLPVGLCFISVGTKERVRVYRYVFDGTRQDITEKAINYALYHAYREVKDL
jgi:PncC family amidohydrolase